MLMYTYLTPPHCAILALLEVYMVLWTTGSVLVSLYVVVVTLSPGVCED